MSNGDNALVDLIDWHIAPMLTPAKTPISGSLADAEALARARDGSFLVAFEGRHRIWRYDAPPRTLTSTPAPIPVPAELSRAPSNGGIEGLSTLPDGRMLALTEEFANRDGSFKGWLLDGNQFAELSYLPAKGSRVTDCAALKNGDVIVLERRYVPFGVLSARVTIVEGKTVKPGAKLSGRELLRIEYPLVVENFEGLSVQETAKGTMTEGEGLWRRAEHVSRNGNLYPTHGLGPVAQYLDIHRGDRFERLVSMSSPSLGLQAYRDRTLAADDPRRRETYACGDMNTSLVRTARGRTVMLQHDVVSPRPYSRLNMVSGTKGAFADYPPRIFFDGQKEHEWTDIHEREGRQPGGIEERYEHPLWQKLRKEAESSGHGGMDYVMTFRLVQCLREGLAPDMDVYDAAAWSAPAALSEQQRASRSRDSGRRAW